MDSGMLVGLRFINTFHNLTDTLGMRPLVILKLLFSPFDTVILIHTISVHQIHTPRHIVVVRTVSIHSPVALNRLPHLCSHVLGLTRSAATFSLARRRFVVGEFPYPDTSCNRVEIDVWVVGQSAHPGSRDTFRVILQFEQILVILVDSAPCVIVI